jgi:predicted dehydrogenase
MGVKLGFSGTGWIAKLHAGMAQGLPGVELAAVANHRSDSMQAFAAEFGIPHQYETVEAMLAGGGVDGLIVCTPNYLHAPQTIAALEAGVHVMVEKPMAMTTGEAESMLEAAGRSGAHLMVAHCWRFHDEVRWLQEQVRAGRLGQIIRTKSCGVHVNFGPVGWFTQQKLAGGGAMADMGIHAVDTTRFLLGDPQPVSVLASIGTHYGNYDVDDTGVVIINWEGGVTSYVESGWWQPHADGPEAGTQVFGVLGFGGVFPTSLKIHNPERTETETEEPDFPTAPATHTIESLEPMYSAQLAYFVDCIRMGRQPNPGGLEGWVNMRIVEAAYASAQTGQLVHL